VAADTALAALPTVPLRKILCTFAHTLPPETDRHA
jgi:hypothetical protein